MCFNIKLEISKIRFPKFTNSGIIALFFISPVLTLPYIIPKSYRGDKISQILTSLFIGLLSICFVPPRADLYRIYLAFFEIQDSSINQVISNLRFDFVLPFAQYFISFIGLDFEIIRLISIAFPYFLYFRLYNHLRIKDKNNSWLYIVTILSVPFMAITLGIRNGLAISLIGYVIIKKYILFEKINLRDYFLLMIAPCIHFSVLWLLMVYVASKIIPNNINKLIIVVFIGIAYFSSFMLEDLLRLMAFDEATNQLVDHYGVNGAYGSRYLFHNFIGSIPEYYSRFIVILCCTYFILFIKYTHNTKICFIIMIIWAFTQQLFGIHYRINLAILTIFPLFIFYYSTYVKPFVWLLIMGALINILINWRAYTISNSLQIVLPFFYIMGVGYTKDWILSNVDSEGTLYIYKR